MIGGVEGRLIATLRLSATSLIWRKASVAKRHKRPGEPCQQGEILYDLETEEACFEVETP
jgi:hypothetical protein